MTVRAHRILTEEARKGGLEGDVWTDHTTDWLYGERRDWRKSKGNLMLIVAMPRNERRRRGYRDHKAKYEEYLVICDEVLVLLDQEIKNRAAEAA